MSIKITLENNVEKQIELPNTFNEFIQYLGNQYYIFDKQFYYKTDNSEQQLIFDDNSYTKMIESVQHQKNSKITQLSRQQNENLKYIQDQDFISLFSWPNNHIDCICVLMNNGNQDCQYCKGKKLLQLDGLRNDLAQQFRIYFKSSFLVITQFIKEKYNKNITTFPEWISFNTQLQQFDDNFEFYFYCKKCLSFCPNQNIVYLQSKQYPQLPICENCYKRLKKEDKLKYIKKEHIPFAPPRIHTQ